MAHKSSPPAKSAKAAPPKAASAPAKGKTAPVAPPKTPTASKAKVNPTTTASGGGPIGKAGATPRHAPLPHHSPKTQRGN